jgi:hypothetical protein
VGTVRQGTDSINYISCGEGGDHRLMPGAVQFDQGISGSERIACVHVCGVFECELGGTDSTTNRCEEPACGFERAQKSKEPLMSAPEVRPLVFKD